jgi:hypothetical protein
MTSKINPNYLDMRSTNLSSSSKIRAEYPLFDNIKNDENYAHEALYGIQEITDFSYSFFSDNNTDAIQKLIQYNIWMASDKQYKIGDQDKSELQIVMRSVYLQFQHGVPASKDDIVNGVKRLNKITVQQVLPGLLSSISGYLTYLKDASSPLMPLPPPEDVSQTGNKNYRDITDVLFGTTVSEYNSKFF